MPKSEDKPHGLKYALVYISNGERIIGYDNADRKGDHKHYRNKEYSYRFTDVDVLISDFFNDIEKYKRGDL